MGMLSTRLAVKIGICALCVTAFVMRPLACAQSAPLPAKGFMQSECGYTGIAESVRAIHLTRLHGRSRKDTLTLQFFPSQQDEHPVHAWARRCSGPGQCDAVEPAEIEFKDLSDKKAGGSYRIQDRDGHTEEGAFSVRANQHFHGLCE